MPFLVPDDVTMRGEWAKFNPWQVPRGTAPPGAFQLMGTTVFRINTADEAGDVVAAAATLAFDSD